MAEITAVGYDYLRCHIQENWSNIALLDDTDSLIKLYHITDSNVNWRHTTKTLQTSYDELENPITDDAPSTATLELEVVVKGSDGGFSLPITFAKSEIRNSLGKVVSSETFANFTMTQTGDKLTVTHKLEVPRVV